MILYSKNGEDMRSDPELMTIENFGTKCASVHLVDDLEYYENDRVIARIKDVASWVKPGGILAVTVRDFEKIARAFLGAEADVTPGTLLGDATKPVRSIMDKQSLMLAMQAARLVGVKLFAEHRFTSTVIGYVPVPSSRPLRERVAVAMTVPRLCFSDSMNSMVHACSVLDIECVQRSGAYYDVGIEASIDHAIGLGVEYVITADYDSVFSPEDIQRLVALADRTPDAAAIAPVQAGRCSDGPILGLTEDVTAAQWWSDMVRVHQAHFGLTLLRVSALKELPKPWFRHKDHADGTRVDADVQFWRNLAATGKSLYLSPAVSIGHIETLISWFTDDMKVVRQPVSEYYASGKPKGVR